MEKGYNINKMGIFMMVNGRTVYKNIFTLFDLYHGKEKKVFNSGDYYEGQF